MSNYVACFAAVRIALPVLLAVCIVFRPCLLSALYLLFLLYLPFVPVPTPSTMKGHSGVYLKLLISVSVITALCQAAFQIYLVTMDPYGAILVNCTFPEDVLRYTGFVRLDGLSIAGIFTWLTPEIVLLISSILVFAVCKNLTQIAWEDDPMSAGSKPASSNGWVLQTMASIGRYLTIIALCLAAIMRPSAQGGLYFIVFVIASTWWACYRQLGRLFAYTLRLLTPVVVVHIVTLYAYQFQYVQDIMPSNETLYTRVFGITKLISVTCDDPREFLWGDAEWASYLNPFILFVLYFLMIMESKLLLMPQLIRGVPPPKKYGVSKKQIQVLQDSTGSVTVAGEGPDDIAMEQLGKGTTEEEEDDRGNFCDAFLGFMEAFLQVLIRNSYILTSIVMMAWSITFHSWVTFVFLLWANILWMIPNQRRAMLRSSPALVFYAWILLIVAYVYSMDLEESEVPLVINHFNLTDIGIERVEYLPCIPLLVKCLYTGMFLVTLRLFMRDRREARRSSTIADMAAPLQVTVGTAAGISRKEEKTDETMKIIGHYAKQALLQYWIWVVAITLFAVAITGNRMTAFRIIYMMLFLTFILCFQISFRIWRRIMYGFWLTVIIFSMMILILIYTYQFKTIAGYWETYLHLSKQSQLDIGLEEFEKKELFVRLATPTFFVVITIIQLQYFHKHFMELSDPKQTSTSDPISDGSSAQGGLREIERSGSEKTDVESSIKYDATRVTGPSAYFTKANFQYLSDTFFLLMEVHMPKVVLFFAMLTSVYDHCFIYLAIVVLICLSFTFGRPVMIFSIYVSSVLVSLMLLARMVYQVHYINHADWDVECEFNVTRNSAEWLGGFKKVNPPRKFPSLVVWNIVYILVVTIWAVINVRQTNQRLSSRGNSQRPFFIFQKIRRIHADRSIKNCLKYLLNFGFYKFGIEICFITMVIVIGNRMDVYAFIYAIWLCLLYSVKRQTMVKLWNIFVIFVVVSTLNQYCMLIGSPPSICLDFGANLDAREKNLFRWAYLYSYDQPLPATNLIGDLIMLMLLSRQSLVFRIEKRYEGQSYAGGSNDSIIHHAEEKGFVNPVPDFITYCRSYLDVFKRGFFLSFMWIALAVVFLTGTSSVNMFSVGYLIGSFMLLWYGSDLYLVPISRLLKLWSYLIGFNISVILVKTGMQLGGCVFADVLKENVEWFVNLFTIGCVLNKQEPLDYQSGISWDAVCFAFLILQKRIFKSYYFFHIINETKATTILASRGAELIEELSLKRLREQEDGERQILDKIKVKMDRIKANQKRLQGADYEFPTNHYYDGKPRSRSVRRRRVPKYYKEAVLSGDYYMFEDLEDDDELDLLEEAEKEKEIEKDDEEPGSDEDFSKRRRSRTIGEMSRVVIIDPKGKALEPQPSTSKDEDEDFTDVAVEPEQTFCEKVVTILKFVGLFIEGLIISLTLVLNKYSRDYQYVLQVLHKEKKKLKETTDYNVGLRLGNTQTWQPAGSYQTLLKTASQVPEGASAENSEEKPPLSDEEGEGEVEDKAQAALPRSPDSDSLPQSESRMLDALHEEEMSSADQPYIIQLLLAIWYIILSHSDVACYIMIFVNHMKTATFLSFPLPLMTLLWGTLTIPRPSKTFWVTIIAYTEIVVLIKCVFQFEAIKWAREATSPVYPPTIIGINKHQHYALWDLLLLLVVFFHRFLLKCFGLWKTSFVPALCLPDGRYKVEDGRLVPIEQESVEDGLSAGPSGALQPVMIVREEDPKHMDVEIAKADKNIENDVVAVETDHTNPCMQFLTSAGMVVLRYGYHIKLHFKRLLDPSSRVAADVYSYMFLCDFFNFFVILIGYSSFGPQQSDEGVQAYLEENRIPVLFLVMLIVQFVLIVMDRAIYLRKNSFGKILFQLLQIFLLHIWLFIVYPALTERPFNSTVPTQMYYMVKCFYFLLSAYQIRCGYPTRILGNFLCKGYNYLNMILFKGFMLIPFLFELRTVMDWMWTDTSMTILDWIKMEDIFAHVFQLKCSRYVETEYPFPRGRKKPTVIKYIQGGLALIFMIGIIWFPLVFFSLGNAVGKSNVPYEISVNLRVGPFEPIYSMSVQSNNIFKFTKDNLIKFGDAYPNKLDALSFLSNYEAEDIAAAKLSPDSAAIWTISPPDRVRMEQEIRSPHPLTIRFQYQVSHESNTKEDSGTIKEENIITIPAMIDGQPNPVRQQLLDMFNKSTPNQKHNVIFHSLVPKFIKVTNRGTAKPIKQFMDGKKDPMESSYRSVIINHDEQNTSGFVLEWWEMSEACIDDINQDFNYVKYLKMLPYNEDNCKQFTIYTFNDKIFPSQLNFITGNGIIGFYTTIVVVIGRLLRGFFAESCFKIMFEDLPNVDRLLQLCFNIYLVRESREFTLEEDLFAKLVFLFRSPETLIKWTRPKEEVSNEEDDEDEAEAQQ